MNYSDLRANLKSAITGCSLFLDFKVSMNVNGFGLHKHSKNEYFSFGGNTRKYPEVFFVDYLYCGIGYKIIEDMLLPILVKNKLIGSGALEQPSYTIGIEKEFPELNPKFLNLPIEVRTTEDISQFIKILSDYFQLYVVPFHARWCDLTKLVPILEEMDDVQVNNYFSTGALFRKVIIFKLVNHANYSNYLNNLIDNFRSLNLATPDEPYFKNYLMALAELKLKLE